MRKKLNSLKFLNCLNLCLAQPIMLEPNSTVRNLGINHGLGKGKIKIKKRVTSKLNTNLIENLKNKNNFQSFCGVSYNIFVSLMKNIGVKKITIATKFVLVLHFFFANSTLGDMKKDFFISRFKINLLIKKYIIKLYIFLRKFINIDYSNLKNSLKFSTFPFKKNVVGKIDATITKIRHPRFRQRYYYRRDKKCCFCNSLSFFFF
jgi:hypothetical protein